MDISVLNVVSFVRSFGFRKRPAKAQRTRTEKSDEIKLGKMRREIRFSSIVRFSCAKATMTDLSVIKIYVRMSFGSYHFITYAESLVKSYAFVERHDSDVDSLSILIPLLLALLLLLVAVS